MRETVAETAIGGRAPYMTRTRLGVSLLFLMDGFMMGSWAPMIPEFAKRLSLSESALGLVILVFGLGSLACMPLAGSQIARFGSRTVTLYAAFVFVPTLLLITLSNSIWTGVLTVFLVRHVL